MESGWSFKKQDYCRAEVEVPHGLSFLHSDALTTAILGCEVGIEERARIIGTAGVGGQILSQDSK